MTGPGRRFDPAEVDGLADGDDVQLARDLERYAEMTGREPGADFVDRVMAAVADEPLPSPGIRRWTPAGILAAVGGAWQIAVTGGRPVALRAQAMALVLIVAIGIAALGTATVVGVRALLGPDASPTPPPSVEPSVAPTASPSLVPTPSASPSPTASPTASPSPSAEPTDTASPTATDDDETPEPTDTDDPDATENPDDDSSGPGSGGSGDSSGPGGGG